jgi:hypothetical protein
VGEGRGKGEGEWAPFVSGGKELWLGRVGSGARARTPRGREAARRRTRALARNREGEGAAGGLRAS